MSHTSRRFRTIQPGQRSDSDDSGILNEDVLLLVFGSMKWDLHVLCAAAAVNRKLRAIAKRLLWRQLCIYRAPHMLKTLITDAPEGRIGGGWHALAKLMFFCCGCESTRNFKLSQPLQGHFVKASRFSKTSGRSFLTRRCRGDMLFVSDPCEHPMGDGVDDLGIYRGVFKGFRRSKTRAFLIGRQVEFEERGRCPYCGSRVWSMKTAGLVPRSAARRLGSHDGGIEYFVCVNGHLYGTCWLVPLSSDDDEAEDVVDHDDDGSDGDYDESGGDYFHANDNGARRFSYENRTATDGSSSSMGEDVQVDGSRD